MKKRILLAALVLMITGWMTSCIRENDFAECPPEKPLQIISTIDFGSGTALWPKGSEIGITLLKAGTNQCTADGADKQYKIADLASGESVPQGDTNSIHLPADGSESDMIAYYPYTTPFDDTYKARLSVLDQSCPDSLDLITSERVCNIPSDAKRVELDFRRRLCKLQFNITVVEVDKDGKETVVDERQPGSSLAVAGMPATGVYYLTDNSLTLDRTTADIVCLINKEGTRGSAIIFPREAGEGVRFVVTLPDGSKHTFLMSPEQALKAGTVNKFDLKIKLKKDVPVVEPEYMVSYELQGALSPGNISVKQGATHVAWGINQSIVVKKGGSFSFLYDSKLAVSASLSDGTVLNMSNNTSYSFADIKGDIHILLSATATPEPPEPPVGGTYKVTYELQGDLTPGNITVKQGGTTWVSGQIVCVKEGESFSFLFNSALAVSACLSDGTALNVSNNTPCTLSSIRKDLHIILSANQSITPPAPVYYKMTYELKDGLTGDNTTVKGNNTAWVAPAIVSVVSGGQFAFQYELVPGNSLPVTVMMNGKVVTGITAGAAKVYTGIFQHMHFVLYGKSLHVVTVITNLTNITSEVKTNVLDSGLFELTIPTGTDIIVKVDGKTVSVKDGKYTIESVTKDTTITLTQKKDEGKDPDLIIKGDVHPWGDNGTVDGGIILPMR